MISKLVRLPKKNSWRFGYKPEKCVLSDFRLDYVYREMLESLIVGNEKSNIYMTTTRHFREGQTLM